MRFQWLVVGLALEACSSRSDVAQPEILVEADKVAVPGVGAVPRTKRAIDDPEMHLQPDEGTLTIAPANANVGVEVAAIIKVAPATPYHVSTDFPTTLTLAPPAGISLAKTRFEAGRGQKGDADELSERGLSFVIKATAEKPGTYEIHGTFAFGVCRRDSCHAKKQPITIDVTAT